MSKAADVKQQEVRGKDIQEFSGIELLEGKKIKEGFYATATAVKRPQ
jgi:hypothetical protein